MRRTDFKITLLRFLRRIVSLFNRIIIELFPVASRKDPCRANPRFRAQIQKIVTRNREAFSIRARTRRAWSDARQSWPRFAWWHFARDTGEEALLASALQVARATSPAHIPSNVSPYREEEINIVRMSCRPICLPKERREREERRVKIGAMGMGYRDRDRSERVPLCIPAKFGLSNHVSPLLPDTRRRPSRYPK